MSESVLATRGLKRSFTQGGVTIEVLRGVDLDVRPGERPCVYTVWGSRTARVRVIAPRFIAAPGQTIPAND